jgi:hypothetical protein
MMPATESLAARAETMLNRLAQLQAQEADLHARTEVEKTRVRASRSREVLSEELRVIPILAEHGVASPVVPDSILPELTKARRSLRSTANAIVGSQVSEIASRIRSPAANAALDSAEKLVRLLLVGLNRGVEQKRQDIQPDGIDQPIVIYPGASDALAVRLKRIQFRLQQKVDGLSPDELEQRFTDIISDVESWAEDRPKLDATLERQNPQVKEFLRQAATDDGAPWSLITPVVQTWLSDPENTVNLKVVLRW